MTRRPSSGHGGGWNAGGLAFPGQVAIAECGARPTDGASDQCETDGVRHNDYRQDRRKAHLVGLAGPRPIKRGVGID